MSAQPVSTASLLRLLACLTLLAGLLSAEALSAPERLPPSRKSSVATARAGITPSPHEMSEPLLEGPRGGCGVRVVGDAASRSAASSLKTGLRSVRAALEDDSSTARPPLEFPFWPLRTNVSWKDVSWPYARGRAVLSTVIPLAVGGTLLRIRPDNRTSNAMGLAVGSAGLLVGPSVGQWCLGGPHLRKSMLHTGARVAGMSGIILTMEWGEQQLEKAGLLGLPFAMMSVGFAIGIAGAGLLKAVAWTIEETPRLACGETEDTQTASVSPAVGPSGGTGVRLAVRF